MLLTYPQLKPRRLLLQFSRAIYRTCSLKMRVPVIRLIWILLTRKASTSERIICNSLRYPCLVQFRIGKRHQACVGIVEGKTRDNTYFTQPA
jgi:hypothetical protein